MRDTLRRLPGGSAALLILILLAGTSAVTGMTNDLGSKTDDGPEVESPGGPENPVSPIRGIRQPPGRGGARHPRPPGNDESRMIDGTGNNLVDTEMGATSIPLIRLVEADYGDGISTLGGVDRPSPREVSNAICAQDDTRTNDLRATDFLWQWGQFLDHDIDLTDGADPPEPAVIPVPTGDPWFDPDGTGDAVIFFNRSIWSEETGTDAGNPRQQLNEITAWIDASNVYGSDAERAEALREFDGSGRLRVVAGEFGDLLPGNDAGLPNAGGDSPELFLAGDVRANEQAALAAMHTLFVREHNRLAAELAGRHPQWTGDEIYDHARRLVGAMMQAITYREFLPALLGRDAIRPYRGYRPNVDASTANLFSTASYRFGHSALSPTLLRLDAQRQEIPEGHLALSDAFFSPSILREEGGIEPLLRGLAGQACQAIDPYVVDDVRNFLFGHPGAGGFDLASLNLQRGRDHGLPGYNATREALGLPPAADWGDITDDSEVLANLSSVYAQPDDIDVWVGALAERPMPGAHVGRLNFVVIRDQFERLRDGDRFWYERVLNRDERRMVEDSTLARIIRRNTQIGHEIQDDVFHLPSPPGGPGGPGGQGGQGGQGGPGGPGGPR